MYLCHVFHAAHPTYCAFSSKQLSKALAIALMVACAVAFMPLLNGQAFAAAKKPAKVKSLKAAQVADTMTAKATWKKGKNCKKYNVKVDGVLVAKKQKAKSYTTTDLTEGAHKIAVAGVNGKKVGKYKTVTVNIVAPKSAVAAVVLDKTAPNVGDTITASLVDKDGNPVLGATATYQWYRTTTSTESGKSAIPGETAASYTVQVADIDRTVYVIATVNGKEFVSKATSYIEEQTVKKLEVTGMSGKASATAKSATIPVTGDVLTAETTPDLSAGLEYQWYRNAFAITGATAKTYTVTSDDQGYQLQVKIKSTNPEAVTVVEAAKESAFTVAACEPISALTAKLNKTANLAVDDTIKAIVKNGDDSAANDVTYQWYQDEVKDANKLSIERGGETASVTVTPDDYGHKLVCEITGKHSEAYYLGTTDLATEAVVKQLGTLRVKTDSGRAFPHTSSNHFTVGTTMTAYFDDEDTTADYVWTVGGVEVATGDSYTLKAEDFGLDEETTSVSGQKIKVTATGNGDYSGTASLEDSSATVDLETIVENFKVVDKDGNVVTTTTGPNSNREVSGNYVAGETLYVEANPASVKNIAYTWVYTADDEVASITGPSFDLDVDPGTTVSVYATYTGSTTDTVRPGNYAKYNNAGNLEIQYGGQDSMDAPNATSVVAIQGGTEYGNGPEAANRVYYLPADFATRAYVAHLTAKKALKSVDVTFDNSQAGNPMESGYTTYTTPEVKAYAHAAVTPAVTSVGYRWYRDSVKSTAISTDPTYQITAADLGHTLICVATGIGAYEGSKVTSEASEAVVASSQTLASMKFYECDSEGNIDAGASAVTNMIAGNYYIAVVTDSTKATVASGVDFVWDGTEAVDYLSTGAMWRAQTGKGQITVTATPDGVNYTGDPLSYTFKTDVAPAGE